MVHCEVTNKCCRVIRIKQGETSSGRHMCGIKRQRTLNSLYLNLHPEIKMSFAHALRIPLLDRASETVTAHPEHAEITQDHDNSSIFETNYEVVETVHSARPRDSHRSDQLRKGGTVKGIRIRDGVVIHTEILPPSTSDIM